ncbi:MAG: AMIN domain-containing protein, partial [Desulfobulbaceae bacterium]|nr:AMIN domain-containing protein [Desulfobulbaceae bacterium]
PRQINQGPVSKVTGKTLSDQKPVATRLEVFLSKDQAYTVKRKNNDIVVNFTPPSASNTVLQKIEVTNKPNKTQVLLRTSSPVNNYKEAKLPQDNERPARLYIDVDDIALDGVPRQIEVGSALERIRTARRDKGLRIVFDSGLDDLFNYKIDSREDGLLLSITDPVSSNSSGKAKNSNSKPTSAVKKSSSNSDQFGFSGYNQQRITVDFFKIDLHNVFRLLGEISGRNMVIEETVKGTLTLALTDVPWDFVLDVVLNLKDLQKEERYNTIVISPKSKGFTWPEKASAKLAIRSEGTDAGMEQDSISIKQRIETPKGVIEAKKFIQMGDVKYKAKDYVGALADYENASSKWPENGRLAKRIAALCLVQLGQNAKAVHYAKIALKSNRQDDEAALQAAIGLANMKKNPAAKEYFDLSVSGAHPSSEALTSYAAFNEKNKNYVATLLLLTKHTELYGDSMETMLSKARIYDMQGDKAKAAKEYQALLLSGYELPADLKRYIKGRLSLISK